MFAKLLHWICDKLGGLQWQCCLFGSGSTGYRLGPLTRTGPIKLGSISYGRLLRCLQHSRHTKLHAHRAAYGVDRSRIPVRSLRGACSIGKEPTLRYNKHSYPSSVPETHIQIGHSLVATRCGSSDRVHLHPCKFAYDSLRLCSTTYNMGTDIPT